MDFQWTSSQRTLREEYFQAGRDLVRPGATERDAAQVFDRGLWERVASTGLFGLHLPQAFGGRALPVWDAVAAFEGFAAGCEDAGFLVALLAHAGLVQATLSTFGSDAQRERWLPGLVDGSLIGCFAITERECGSDVRAIRLSAAPDADGSWILNGEKWNITNAPVADLCLTFARLTHRAAKPATAFLTDLSEPGVTRSAPFDLMGNRTSPIGALTFVNHRVPSEGMMGGAGQGLRVLDFSFTVERVLTGIGIASCLEPVIGECLSYAARRQAFGRPIGDYRFAVRVHGNHGYRRGGVIERFCRDGVGVLLAGGTAEIHKNIIWRKWVQRRARHAAGNRES